MITALDISSDVLTTATHRLHRFSAKPAGPAGPAGPVVARVLLLHGYGDHAGKYLHVLTWLAEHGVAAQAVDFRGHGRSTGRVASVRRWDEYLDDLKQMLAAEAVSNGATGAPLFILAHSHGGLVAVVAGLRGLLDGCAGVILSAPFLKLKMTVGKRMRAFAWFTSMLVPGLRLKSGVRGTMLTHDPEFNEAAKTDPYVFRVATPRWFTSVQKMQAAARASASQFKLPLLVLVPKDDQIADPDAAVAFFNQAGSSDKQLRVYPDCRHELLRETIRDEIFQMIVAWITARISA